ncbi:MAG TPA: aminoglycoside phosphotransferase family protein [Chloroflexi bacterium]|jgi:hygromycin-B 4-O-kinase|nr:aminoglycoside phosphotransferase family protein [Chloroflexota bacterium]HAL26054.1 aminoglycoside phosphotransferase family protein [Chloroflexota bacterium]
MDPSQGVALPQATEFLRSRFGATVRAVTAIAQQGLWSNAYRFQDGAADRVIRFSAMRANFDKDDVVARRAPSELPVPRILEIGPAFGGYFAVSEHAPGSEIDTLDAGRMRRVLPSLLATLDAVRGIDLSGSSGYGLWTGDGEGNHRTWPEALLDNAAEVRARLAATAVGADAFDVGLARLRELVPALPAERHLIHCDLLHHNVLEADGRITALLDWGSSTIGDFVYDIAWLTFWAEWYPAWAGIDFRAAALAHYDASGVAVARFDERLRAYEIDIGLGNQGWFAVRGDDVNLRRVANKTRDLAS